MAKLVLVRHGQSQWNLENRFTGWIDVPLTPYGCEEAKSAGEKLKSIIFFKAFTSSLQRAQRTLEIMLETMGVSIPIEKDAALNERHYGALQGLNKDETKKQFGEEQVKLWRRSYDIVPPGGESLRDTTTRIIPYYRSKVEPELKRGNVLVVAHGNSLRSLVMHLEHLTREEIVEVNIPTGSPLIYEVEESSNQIMEKKYW